MASLRPHRLRSDQILALLEDIPSDNDSTEESAGKDEEDDSGWHDSFLSHYNSCVICNGKQTVQPKTLRLQLSESEVSRHFGTGAKRTL